MNAFRCRGTGRHGILPLLCFSGEETPFHTARRSSGECVVAQSVSVWRKPLGFLFNDGGEFVEMCQRRTRFRFNDAGEDSTIPVNDIFNGLFTPWIVSGSVSAGEGRDVLSKGNCVSG